MLLSLCTDNLEEEDSFGGELNEDEFPFIIHGFQTDFKRHPLNFSIILDCIETTLKCQCCYTDSWTGFVPPPEHKCDSAESLLCHNKDYLLSPVSVCDRYELGLKSNKTVDELDKEDEMMTSKCIYNAYIGRSKWRDLANKSSGSVGNVCNAFAYLCIVCDKFSEMPCHLHSKFNKNSESACSELKIPVSNTVVSSDLTLMTIEAGICVESLSSKSKFALKTCSPSPLRRCSLRSLSSSGYGSEIHRQNSNACDRDDISVSSNTDVGLCHKTDISLLSTSKDCDKIKTALSNHNIENLRRAKTSNSSEAASLLILSSSIDEEESVLSEVNVKRNLLHSRETEVITSPSKVSLSGLDSGLGLDSDPGFSYSEGESDISVNSDEENHFDDHASALRSDIDNGSCPIHKGKKSALHGGQRFNFCFNISKTLTSNKIPIGVRHIASQTIVLIQESLVI